MDEVVLLLQMASTLALAGLIWFVQIVHYPLFDKVGAGGFADYEKAHQQRTTVVVAPLMLVEATTAVLLIWLRPASLPASPAIFGVLLIGLLWGSTFFWQVPLHERLAKSYQPSIHRRLVQSNWLRTAAWTARGVLVCWMAQRLLAAG